MNVSSSWPVSSSASNSMPTPSSTAAIIAARKPDLLLLARMDGVEQLARFRRFAQLDRFRPRRLLLHELLGRQHVGLLREDAAPVEILVALGGHVAVHLERAVGGLLRVRVHRLVREPQRPRLRVPALHEIDRHLVHDVGDVALALHVLALLVQLRIVQPAVAVVGDPEIVAGPRLAAVAHVPLADVRGLVAEPLQLEVVVGHAGGSRGRARRCR